MTPRSRKPVMLPVALPSSSEQSTLLRSNSFSSLREEDEDEFNFDNMPASKQINLYKSKSESDFTELLQEERDHQQRHALTSKILSEGSKMSILPAVEYLTSPFRLIFFLIHFFLCF